MTNTQYLCVDSRINKLIHGLRSNAETSAMVTRMRQEAFQINTEEEEEERGGQQKAAAAPPPESGTDTRRQTALNAASEFGHTGLTSL